MSLCILPPKLSGYKRHFDETKYMSFLIKNNELLEKYNEVWDKSVRLLTLFAMGVHTVPMADFIVCCGSIRHLEKMKFSDNS